MIKMYFDNIMLLVEVVLGLKNARVHSSFFLSFFLRNISRLCAQLKGLIKATFFFNSDLQLIKMRTQLAILNNCALLFLGPAPPLPACAGTITLLRPRRRRQLVLVLLPFLGRAAAASLCWYYYPS